MKTIIYENSAATFQFNFSDLQKSLNNYKTTHHNEEISELQSLLASASGDQINIPEKYTFAAYITFDLITHNIGTIICKSCSKKYQPTQLKTVAIGHGRNPFSINLKHRKNRKGGFKYSFKKKKKLPGLSGGKGIICPKGHELLKIRIWII